MATAKRLYLYIVSGVGLGMILWSCYSLLHILLDGLGFGPGGSGSTALSSNANKDALSMAIAVLGVGLLVWLFHWGLVVAMVSGQEDAPAAERASIVRSVYLAVIGFTALAIAAYVWATIASSAIADAIGAKLSYSAIDYSVYVAIALPATAAWAYHAFVRAQDLRHGQRLIAGAAAWVSRLYLYGAAFIGIVGAINGVASLISAIGYQLAMNPSGAQYGMLPGSSAPWWERPAVAALVAIAIWGFVWLIHWLYSNRLRASEGPQGVAERTSRVRVAFLMLVVLWGVETVASGLILSIWMSTMRILGLDLGSGPLWYLVIVPPATTIPAALAWALHRRRGIAESATGPAGVSARRISGYLTALVGIGLLAVGASVLLWLAISKVISPASLDHDAWKWSLSMSAGYLVVGALLWPIPWLFAQRRRRFEGVIETESSSRGFYLYTIVAASTLISAGSLALILYRLARWALGLPEPGFASEITAPLAAFMVAVTLLAYHAIVLVRDANPPAVPEPAAPVAPGAAPQTPAAPPDPTSATPSAIPPATPPVPRRSSRSGSGSGSGSEAP
ncbi:MAG: DUF5671 domain-containing protein, partial [Candidatus Limnocylindrales bacterium]